LRDQRIGRRLERSGQLQPPAQLRDQLQVELPRIELLGDAAQELETRRIVQRIAQVVVEDHADLVHAAAAHRARRRVGAVITELTGLAEDRLAQRGGELFGPVESVRNRRPADAERERDIVELEARPLGRRPEG
jgi:hypothetical protein